MTSFNQRLGRGFPTVFVLSLGTAVVFSPTGSAQTKIVTGSGTTAFNLQSTVSSGGYLVFGTLSSTAVDFNATAIVSTTNAVIDGGATLAYTLNNAGTISATGSSFAGVYLSTVSTASSSVVVNQGSISGGSQGIYISSSTAQITNQTGGSITGGVNGIQVLRQGTVVNASGATITGGSANGVNIAGANSAVANAGSITTSSTTGQNGVIVGAGSSVANGSIDGGTTTFSGAQITGNTNGVQISGDGGTVTNYAGNITATSTNLNEGTGVYINGKSGAVTNLSGAGIIGAGTNGILFSGAGTGSGTATIANAGSITGGQNGIQLGMVSSGVASGNGGTITNTGSISGQNYNGVVVLSGTATLYNGANASIVGGGANGVQFGTNTSSTSAVTNDGVIRGNNAGVALQNGGSLSNGATGTIESVGSGATGNYNGVTIEQAPGVVNNSGVIRAASGDGVMLGNGGTLINDAATSRIEGGRNGIQLVSGGTISHNAGSIVGDTANGILASGGATIDSSALIQGASNAVQFEAGNNTMTLHSGSVTRGAIQTGSGSDRVTVLNGADISAVPDFAGGSGQNTLVFDGYNGAVAGSIDPWTLVHFTGGANATLTSGNRYEADLFQLDSGSTLGFSGSTGTLIGDVSNAGTLSYTKGAGVGQYVVVGTLTNSGLVDLASSGTPGNTLSVGNYVGSGGTLNLRTVLESDDAPSDKLIINGGSATGTSGIRITNAGGSGASTTANGIPVVQAINGATTDTGAFALVGEARGGAYDYRLFQGGLSGTAPNDWFLRSDFIVPPGPAPDPVVDGEFPIDPPPTRLSPGTYPIIGPELATYGVAQPIARQMGLTSLGTMHERIGDTLTDANAGPANEGWAQSGWARIFGQQIDNRYRAFTAPDANGSLIGFQVGADIWRGSLIQGHRDATGVYFTYGSSNVNVDGLVTNAAATDYVRAHTGSLDLDAYSGGAYWTHYGPGGWYLDAIVQGTHYDGNATTQFANLPISGTGILTSLEAGYPIPLALGPNFVLEPQAQVIWQHVSLGEANDGLGDVDLGSTSGVTGRIGVRGQWTITRANGEVWQPYLRANLWRDWGGQATTTFSGVDQVPLATQATRMDFAVGVTAKLDTRMSLYGQFGYQFSINNSDTGRQRGVWGDIGMRLVW